MSVRLEIHGGVAEIVLDRPDVLNALDDDMVAEFHTVLDGAAGARCVLVRGEGRGFSAGRDLSTAAPLTEDAAAILDEVFNPLIARIAELAVPTIAAVHGACLGVGFGIAMACDWCSVPRRPRSDRRSPTSGGLGPLATPRSSAGGQTAPSSGAIRTADDEMRHAGWVW